MTAQDQPKVIIDPGNPAAGRGGVIPPGPKFQPGQSGNPGGRRKGASIPHEIERRLAKGAEFDESGELVKAGTEACAIAGALIEVAAGQRDPADVDVKAAMAILDRVDGPVVKEINHQGGLPIRVVIKGIDSP